ncbi:hypothetical protein [Chryseobacterium sp. MP_3.2]|uniref:hypothetical protein n=1 Tax=Chryseobacterium sp. MP_3.2 TaxID=3071712 RepID=UPI002E03EC4B|nr:protein CpxP [Chryseobacterium sp. MP_3.2]
MKKIILSAAMIAFGTFAMAQETSKMTKKNPAHMEQKRQENMQMMKQELNLTSAQMDRIKSLQDKNMAERKANAPAKQAERREKMAEMKAKRAQHNAEMKKILTADQYTKWEANKKEKMQKKGRKMSKMQQVR